MSEAIYLYEDRRAAVGVNPTTPQVVGGVSPLPEAEQRRREAAFWGGMSVEERLETLMRVANFHVGLVGLVSDELHERMRAVQGLTPEQAEIQRAQMRRIVAAMRQ